MRNTFSRSMTRANYERSLSATWTAGNGQRRNHAAIVTLDDALAQIERKNRIDASRVTHGQSAKQIFAQANFAAARTTNVKMPVVHIQTIDVDKIGAR